MAKLLYPLYLAGVYPVVSSAAWVVASGVCCSGVGWASAVSFVAYVLLFG